MQMVFAQKFFKYLTTRQNEDSNSPKLGRCFFEGVINTHYFGRVLGKFKTISEFYKKAVVDAASEKETLGKRKQADSFKLSKRPGRRRSQLEKKGIQGDRQGIRLAERVLRLDDQD